jgi:hypothetical protein
MEYLLYSYLKVIEYAEIIDKVVILDPEVAPASSKKYERNIKRN